MRIDRSEDAEQYLPLWWVILALLLVIAWAECRVHTSDDYMHPMMCARTVNGARVLRNPTPELPCQAGETMFRLTDDF